MANEGQIAQLANEVALARTARVAYDTFIKEFIGDRRVILFEAFQDLGTSDTEGLMEVKRMLYTLETLENDIKTIIDTGRMASKTIEDGEK
jgi:hypothetical protein